MGFTRLMRRAQAELEDHGEDYDGFLFVFSGHGNAELICDDSSVVCLSDGEEIRVRDIPEYFKNDHGGIGHNFVGKPRIFVIEACRGDEFVEANSNDDDDEYQTDGPNSGVYHPVDDVLIIQASPPRYVAYRDPKKGSLLIDALCQVMSVVTKNTEPIALDDVVLAIKQKVATLTKISQKKVVQVAESTSTLKKKVLISW